MTLFATNLFYVPLQFNNFTVKALIDTGAFSSAISRNLVQKNKNFSPESIKVLDTSYPTKVRVADGQQINGCGTAKLCFQKMIMENLLVQFHDIFARQRLNLGKNTDCLVKFTPEHDRMVYSLNPATPIHLRNELLIELALIEYYDIITTLPFSKYSVPIFAQRKSSGKLRILIDLRRTSHLLRYDYKNNNFPIPTMADSTAHLAGKSIFAKMDSSQAYFSMQMANERIMQLLAFNFGGRTFAFKRLAQGLNRSPTAFNSCVSKHS